MSFETKYSEMENMPCHVEYLQDGVCSVTFTLPESQINAFVLMLTSLSSLFRGLGWKAKTNIDAIHERNVQRIESQNTLIKEFENATIDAFKKFSDSGYNAKEAVSLTVANIKLRYAFASYDIIKKCLIKNKSLKSTGYYKKR